MLLKQALILLLGGGLRACGQTVSTLAGTGVSGSTNGLGIAATFTGPTGIAVTANKTIAFVADPDNNMIRQAVLGLAAANTTVTTLAGGLTPGRQDALGTLASFSYPSSIAVNANATFALVVSVKREFQSTEKRPLHPLPPASLTVSIISSAM